LNKIPGFAKPSMKDKILVIGSSNIDMTMKMDHLPQKGETVMYAVFMQTYGGKGANQAVAASRARGQVIFVNSVGEDVHTSEMLENFVAEGIDHSKQAFEEAAIILMQYEIPAETVKRVLVTADEMNIPVMWNFAPAREFDRTYLKSRHFSC